MKHVKLILIAVLLFFSCSKIKETQIEKNGIVEKKTRIAPHCSLLLIPSGSTARIGFICDGYVYPAQNYLQTYHIVTGVVDANPPNFTFYDIVNPNLLAGLPFQIVGFKLTGLALTGPPLNYPDMPSIYLSYTSNANHFLLKADLVGNFYEIVSAVILNSPFANASNGWKLHDIEYSNGKLTGLFTDATHSTIVADIDPVSGICTSYINIANKRCCGMDIKDGIAYILLFEDINATTYGRIIKYQLGAVNYNTLNLSISKTNPSFAYNIFWASGSYDYDFFLSLSPCEGNYISIYNYGNTVENLLKFNLSTPATPAVVASNKALWYDIIANTFFNSQLGFVITDAAN